MAELEQRIAHALAVAEASEVAALEIGAAALDAAQQARRAAELAERASQAALAGRAVADSPTAIESRRVGEPGLAPVPTANGEGPAAPAPTAEDPRLHAFNLRADRIGARLDRLRGPVAAP